MGGQNGSDPTRHAMVAWGSRMEARGLAADAINSMEVAIGVRSGLDLVQQTLAYRAVGWSPACLPMTMIQSLTRTLIRTLALTMMVAMTTVTMVTTMTQSDVTLIFECTLL